MDEVMQAFRDLIREEFGCETYSYQDILWERYVYQLEELYRQSRIRQYGCDDYDEYLYKYSGVIPEIYEHVCRDIVNYQHLINKRGYLIDITLYEKMVRDGLIKNNITRILNMLDKMADVAPIDYPDMPKKMPRKRKRKPYE